MAIFLGIDGGGSKTSCLIGDERSVLGSGTAGGGNVIRVGEARAREALTTAITQACDHAHVNPSAVERTCVGMAGAARPEIAGTVRRVIAEMVGGEIVVAGDMDIALQAAFGTGPGVVVISGTGSIAWGRNAAGETARAGGWGYAISDEGSGHWIGRAAVSLGLRARDQGESTRILEFVMKHWNLSTFEQLIVAANASPPPDFAGLVPVVLEAAENGDAVARQVLMRAGTELARLASLVIRRLFVEKQETEVATSGGVLTHCDLVRQSFATSLHSRIPQVKVMPTIVDPVQGALEIARRGR